MRQREPAHEAAITVARDQGRPHHTAAMPRRMTTAKMPP